MKIELNPEVRKLLTIRRKLATVSLEDINTRFYIRVGLDEERVAMFAEMLENGKTLSPILVTEDKKTLIDGRTRLAAHERAGRKTIKCVVCEEADDETLITAAFLSNANPDASKPPSRQDIRHTVELMLKAGASKVRIRKCLVPSMGPALVGRYIKDAESKIKKRRLSQARAAVADERMNIQEAAQHYAVTFTALRRAVSGKPATKTAEQNLASSKSHLSRAVQRVSMVFSKQFGRNMELFEMGELSAEELQLLLKHERRLIANVAKAHEDRLKRLKKMLELAKA